MKNFSEFQHSREDHCFETHDDYRDMLRVILQSDSQPFLVYLNKLSSSSFERNVEHFGFIIRHTSVCIYLYIYIYIYLSIYLSLSLSLSLSLYIYIYIYIYIYNYITSCSAPFPPLPQPFLHITHSSRLHTVTLKPKT